MTIKRSSAIVQLYSRKYPKTIQRNPLLNSRIRREVKRPSKKISRNCLINFNSMENSEHWSTILANIVTSFGILSLIGLLIAYRQTQNQFKFTVMLSCIDRFQQLIPVVRNDDQDIERLKKYIDLTNEELFYFQRRYIPKEVMIEWLDNICDLLPIYEKDSKLPLNYTQWTVKQIHDQRLLHGYPRLLKAFTLEKDKINPNDKITLIKLVTANLGIKTKARHFKQAFFDSYSN